MIAGATTRQHELPVSLSTCRFLRQFVSHRRSERGSFGGINLERRLQDGTLLSWTRIG